MTNSSLSGVVLVGGRSTRMGRDKARLAVGGHPLWRHQVRLLESCGARPVLVALRPRQRSLGAPGREIRDRVGGAGPLAGLARGLEASTAAWVAVLAVDLPAMKAAWFRRLQRHCCPGRGAVFLGPHGYEPLAAIYPQSAAGVTARRLRAGHLALQGLVRGFGRAAATVKPRPRPIGAGRRR
jgi:molybdopterin-guanine dinucleotide biosynthesis protein A